jgi:predicted PurR-regulated permease PerM
VAVGVLAVDRLLGFAGLLVAVPIIVTVKLTIEELWVRPIEASYERSVGSPARGRMPHGDGVMSGTQ